ncbi:MAG: type II toxin-antitoxin system PemK/MazF family toxin [Nitrospinae bacterium]|nr:type II toxin-antitoxin system PemK/MazF family toxin [Nitrospinota bacterium]
MKSFPGRGEIYWVKLDPAIGSEISKTRPAVIISNDTGNRYSDRVIVAPITSKGMEKVYPFEVEITAESGVSDVSKILLDQIRTIDKSRLGKRIGQLNNKKMEEVSQAIRISLSV